MATIDYGMGDMEFRCTMWTLVVYEQEFVGSMTEKVTGDLVADTMGKVIVTSDDLITVTEDGVFAQTVVDYTRVNWNGVLRALWAMLKTSEDIAVDEGRKVRHVPSYDAWSRELLRCEPDMNDLHVKVADELLRGLFRAGAAASGKTSEREG